MQAFFTVAALKTSKFVMLLWATYKDSLQTQTDELDSDCHAGGENEKLIIWTNYT
jgi:hypothetical protein